MNRQTDRDFLIREAYAEASDLNTRLYIQEHYRTNPIPWFQWVFDRLVLPPQSRILELGCGPGTLWLQNRHRLPPGCTLVLTDLSPGMLQQAQSELSRTSHHFIFATADVQAIPFTSGLFDAVIANGVFDHVPRRQQALVEVERVLKAGGRLFASAGGRTHLQEIEQLVRPFVPDADYGGDPEQFGLENGDALLSSWFYRVERHCYQDKLVFRDPDPIIAYVFSERAVKSALVDDQKAAFIAFVQVALLAQGQIQVTTDKGIFVAHKHQTYDNTDIHT